MKTNASGETYVAEMSFKDAARLVCRAWRKSHGYRTPPPALSHALSIYEDSVWIVLDSEAANHDATSAGMNFREASPATCKTWCKRYQIYHRRSYHMLCLIARKVSGKYSLPKVVNWLPWLPMVL